MSVAATAPSPNFGRALRAGGNPGRRSLRGAACLCARAPQRRYRAVPPGRRDGASVCRRQFRCGRDGAGDLLRSRAAGRRRRDGARGSPRRTGRELCLGHRERRISERAAAGRDARHGTSADTAAELCRLAHGKPARAVDRRGPRSHRDARDHRATNVCRFRRLLGRGDARGKHQGNHRNDDAGPTRTFERKRPHAARRGSRQASHPQRPRQRDLGRVPIDDPHPRPAISSVTSRASSVAG